MAREIKIKIDVVNRGAKAGIRELGREVSTLSDHTVRGENRISAAFERMGGAADVFLGNLAADAANFALNSIRNLVAGGIRLLNDSVQESGISLIASRKLDQALLNVGDASEESRKHLKDLASEVQSFSNFGDDSIITAQAMLLSFKEVAGAEGAALLTSRLADVAAGLADAEGGTVDLNNVAGLMGRALSQGAGALREAKVSLDEEAEAAFNAASGMDRVRMLAEILDSNFKGLAAATQDPLVQLQNAIGDIKEELGRGLLPVVHELSRELIEASNDEHVRDLARQIGEHLGNAVRTVFDLIRDNKGDIIEFWTESVSAANELKTIVGELYEAFVPLFGLIGAISDETDEWWTWGDNIRLLTATIHLFSGEFVKAGETWGRTALMTKLLGPQMSTLADETNNAALSFLSARGQLNALGVGFLPANKGLKDLLNTLNQPTPPVLDDLAEQGNRTLASLSKLGPELNRFLEWKLQRTLDTETRSNQIMEEALASEQTRINARIAARNSEVDAYLQGKHQEAEAQRLLEKAEKEAGEQRVKSAALGAASNARSVSDIGNSVRQIIKARLAEAIAGALAKEFGSKGLFGILTGAVAAGAAAVAFEKLVPSFQTGTQNFEGGLAYVHKGELLVNLPRGTDVIPADRAGSMMQGGFNDSRMVGALRSINAAIHDQTERLEAVERQIVNDPYRFIDDTDRVRNLKTLNNGI